MSFDNFARSKWLLVQKKKKNTHKRELSFNFFKLLPFPVLAF